MIIARTIRCDGYRNRIKLNEVVIPKIMIIETEFYRLIYVLTFLLLMCYSFVNGMPETVLSQLKLA